MIVDDHEVVRLGLRTVLDIEEDLEIVAEAESGADALQKNDSLRPDVVLLDVVMAHMDGIETCRELACAAHVPRVVMLTSHDNEQAVASSIMAGACGYLLKNVGRQEIIRAIRSVAAGESLLDPALARRVKEQLAEKARAPQDDPLTEREHEILRCVAEGKTNKEIAAELFISEKTARNHVSRILEKLGFARRSQAAAYAASKGLMKKPDKSV
ncbi:MAG: response regulator transcription factor [Armatimonadetes bacterium]|nr:response regulator transcription factor [Armatimonadota bacterium]